MVGVGISRLVEVKRGSDARRLAVFFSSRSLLGPSIACAHISTSLPTTHACIACYRHTRCTHGSPLNVRAQYRIPPLNSSRLHADMISDHFFHPGILSPFPLLLPSTFVMHARRYICPCTRRYRLPYIRRASLRALWCIFRFIVSPLLLPRVHCHEFKW